MPLLLFFSCPDPGPDWPDRDFRQDMKDFVGAISVYMKNAQPGFLIIPQNGHTLYTVDGETTGIPDTAYLATIDGLGREDLFYGFAEDNVATPTADRNEMIAFLDIAEAAGVQTLVTDYCWTPSFMDDSYTQNAAKNYISFAADHRGLDNIPTHPATPYNQNTSDITSLAAAQNFLYVLDPSALGTKAEFIATLDATNYDLFIIDAYDAEGNLLTTSDLAALQTKPGGGSRLVIAYMSIGEAEEYRYYWDPLWDTNRPVWLLSENPDWPGNFKVFYWDPEWQAIIFGNDNSYAKKILDAGFDGVYLDLIDAYEYFE